MEYLPRVFNLLISTEHEHEMVLPDCYSEEWVKQMTCDGVYLRLQWDGKELKIINECKIENGKKLTGRAPITLNEQEQETLKEMWNSDIPVQMIAVQLKHCETIIRRKAREMKLKIRGKGFHQRKRKEEKKKLVAKSLLLDGIDKDGAIIVPVHKL